MITLKEKTIRALGSAWNSALPSRVLGAVAELPGFSINHDTVSNLESDYLLVASCYPFLSLREIEQSISLNGKIITVVFENQSIEPMVDVLKKSSLVVCFNRAARDRLLTLEIQAERILLGPLPVCLNPAITALERSAMGEIELLVPARRMKRENVDSLLGVLYHGKACGKEIKVTCFAPESDGEVNNFSRYLRDQVAVKGFSNSVKFVNSQFGSKEAKEHYGSPGFTILFNANDQNQLETIEYSIESLEHGFPVLLEENWNALSLNGISTFKSGEKSAVSAALFGLVSSSNLMKQLILEVGKITNVSDFQDLILEGILSAEDFSKVVSVEDSVTSPAIISSLGSVPRILLQNRSNAFEHPGGDTVVMQRLLSGFSKDKVNLEVCVDGTKNPDDYDLVHLFNFAIREVTESQARNCVNKNVPYVVTTLYEDWPVFYNQMATMYLALKAYVEHGQPFEAWNRYQEAGKQVDPSGAWDNSYAANNAELLIATGSAEVAALKRDYPKSKNIVSIPLGCEVTDYFDDGKLFKSKFGLSDFVLCVGRLEWRKNQLMLLKALEDSDIPVVFAASSFTYQPEYEALCRNFKRRGNTVFLSRLTPEELASAYQAAKVHVLPSWYELPGLVSLESARYGTPVVVSNNGTTQDYLGKLGIYCDPSDATSIRNGVLEGFNRSKSEDLANAIGEFTWENSISRYMDSYLSAIEKSPLISKVEMLKESDESQCEVISVPTIASETVESKVLLLCEKGDSHFKIGDFVRARDCYEQAISNDPSFGRAQRSMGALCLVCQLSEEANDYFNKALELDPFDCKALLGRGAVLWENGKKMEAFDLYRQASDLSPGDTSAILYLVNSAYELDQLEDLEKCLRRYLRDDPSNVNIQYCLAGCYFKQDKYSAALGVLERLFTVNSNHSEGRELKKLIEEKISLIEPNAVADSTLLESKSSKSAGSAELSELEELKATRQYLALITRADQLLSNANYCDTALDHFDLLKAEGLGLLGKIDDSKTILNELASRDVLLTRVYSDLGALALAEGNVNESSEYFELSLKEDKSNDNSLAGLAMCAQSMGNLEDAWNLFEQALIKNSQNIQAIYGLVQLGYEFDRLGQVEIFLREYLEFKPIDISILYSLAGCLYAQGKSQEAVGELKNILLFDPTNEPALELIEKINIEDRSISH